MTPHRFRAAIATLCIAIATFCTSLAAPLAAQEIVNGTFDTDLTGWIPDSCEEVNPDDCSHLWVDFDRRGSSSSGAARMKDFFEGGAILSLRQCVPASAGQTWAMQTWGYIPSSSPSVEVVARLIAYSAPDCTTYIDRADGNVVLATDAWTMSSVSWDLPPTTQSIQVRPYSVDLGGGVPTTVYVDDVRIGIFFSPFDDTLLDDWSEAVP